MWSLVHLTLINFRPRCCVVYCSRAYALCPKEPLISLLLGVTYLNRAVQRITDNRHLQIVQGFTFLYKYFELRQSLQYAQEAEYNLGRAFQSLSKYLPFYLIGIVRNSLPVSLSIDLTNLAVPYYERALVLPSHKMVQEVGEEAVMRGHTVDELLESVYDWEVPHIWHDIEDDETDLRPEAAYNLHLIYVTSGTPGLAQMLMLKYCSI
jgi:general transcription factor 3C polypeptide 3 (transcription factor C subunit 4)